MWGTILQRCCLFSGLVLLACVGIFSYLSGVNGAYSALFGGLTIVLFSGISLVVAIVVSKRNPDLLLASFGASYLVKIALFAALFIAIKKPDWLEGAAFVYSALTVLLMWLGTEVMTFMKYRLPAFNSVSAPESRDRGKNG